MFFLMILPSHGPEEKLSTAPWTCLNPDKCDSAYSLRGAFELTKIMSAQGSAGSRRILSPVEPRPFAVAAAFDISESDDLKDWRRLWSLVKEIDDRVDVGLVKPLPLLMGSAEHSYVGE